MQSRRNFLKAASAISVGFGGLGKLCASSDPSASADVYGPLRRDPKGLLDLPKGFSYKIISTTGDEMTDGWRVPAGPDGMAAFAAPDGRSTVLIRNHELEYTADWEYGAFPTGQGIPKSVDPSLCYGADAGDGKVYAGGTTTVVYDPENGWVYSQYLSLVGTNRNCAGGPTPWGTWVTCEEPDLKGLNEKEKPARAQKHGFCFEVFPSLTPRLQKPRPLPAWGRFRHEAIAVDPETRNVYLTEDHGDGLIYRFVPDDPKNYEKGKLQALMIEGQPKAITGKDFPVGKRFKVKWLDLEDPLSPGDTLRKEGFEAGAAQFSRGEGMWYGRDGIYFACTSGGANKGGQIWRYFPESQEVELYLEPNDFDLLQNCDNLTIARWGDLFICEDAKKQTNMIRGVTTDGKFYNFAANALNDSEFAGVCFAPNHDTMFLNIQTPGITFAITGPWKERKA